MTDKQITRNAEEQEAFAALLAALSRIGMKDFAYGYGDVAEKVERGLLASGFQIVKIPPINPVVLMPRKVCRDHTPHSPHENCDGNNS